MLRLVDKNNEQPENHSKNANDPSDPSARQLIINKVPPPPPAPPKSMLRRAVQSNIASCFAIPLMILV